MGAKLKNMRAAENHRNKSNGANINNVNERIIEIEDTVEILHDDESCAVDMEFLQSTVVSADNLDQIKEKLRRTMHYRHKIMANPRTDVLESFPFFLTSPELVRKLFVWKPNRFYLSITICIN